MNDSPAPMGRLRWWAPAIVTMILIFVGSTDLGAMSHQSRFLLPLLRWFGFGESAIHGIILAIRKLAHLTEYSLLAIFVWRALRQRHAFRPRLAWDWREALAPLAICVGYALLDEFHQSFVPSRGASLWDVLIDSCGAAIGLALLWSWHRTRAANSPT